MAHDLRRVVVLGTGGTIASVPAPGAAPGVHPRLNATTLASAIGGPPAGVAIEAEDVLRKASPSLTLADVIAIRDAAAAAVDAGADGIVVTHGTSSLEESAYATSLLWDRHAPLVLTGAMRNPTLAGADGPANVRAAIVAAASPAVSGVVVAFDGELWLPRHLRKTHTNSTAPFTSRQTGRIGWISEDRAAVELQPVGRQTIALGAGSPIPEVALITPGFGDEGLVPRLLEDAPIAGVVIEAMGPGHVPDTWVQPLEALAARVPVIVASRTGAGIVYRNSYGFPGSDIDLAGRGVIGSGVLDGRKARILLQLLLAAGAGDGWSEAFASLSQTQEAHYPPRAGKESS
jgi:L-asparaginase